MTASSGCIRRFKHSPPEQKKKLSGILFDVFRPELIRRHEAAKDSADCKLLDMIIDLTKLKKQVAGWQAIGMPAPAERIWHYYAFDPSIEKEKLHPRESNRFRDITLPPGMDQWFGPGFDDSKWKSGRTPIGVGMFKAHGHGSMWTATPDHSFKNNSDWGDGEFLLMRTTFNVTNLDDDYYRLNILADQGYHIYLNGHRIHSFIWFEHFPKYVQSMLGKEAVSHLKKGTNTLAVYCNVRYEQDAQTVKYHTVGQMNLFLEGLKMKEIGLANRKADDTSQAKP